MFVTTIKNRFLPELYPQDAPNASQRPFLPIFSGKTEKMAAGGASETLCWFAAWVYLDGYIKQPHSGRMGLFMQYGWGSYSAEMR